MDKYEYKHLVEQIQSLIDQGEYAEAAAIADRIDWRRVRSVMTLGTISDLYKINGRYEDARDIMLLAYDRKPENRQICYSLCELYIKTGDPVEAAEFYKEFEKLAPKDPGRYVLKYKLYDAYDVTLDEKIEVLEKLKEEDYQEKWMYELANLYHRRGLGTKCVEVCDEIILWFGTGKYVNMAMELKMLHEPLTPEQQRKYDNRFQEPVNNAYQETATAPEARHDNELVESKAMQAYADQDYVSQETIVLPSRNGQAVRKNTNEWDAREVERQNAEALGHTRVFNPEEVRRQLNEHGGAKDDFDIQVKTVDVGQYNTMNLQAEIAAGLKEILDRQEGENSHVNTVDVEHANTTVIPPIVTNSDSGPLDLPVMEGVDENDFATGQITVQESEHIEPEKAEKEEVFFENGEETYLDENGYFHTGKAPEHMEEKQEGEKSELPDWLEQPKKPQWKENPEEPKQPEQPVKPFKEILLEKEALKAQPPEAMAKVLTQEADGQLKLVVPESKRLEKQITGQLSIDDIRAEWERMKLESQAKQEEEFHQQLLRQTGKMFTEFEEAIRDNILRQMEDKIDPKSLADSLPDVEKEESVTTKKSEWDFESFDRKAAEEATGMAEMAVEEATTVTETAAEEVASVSEEVTEARAETGNMFAQVAGETEAVTEAATEAVAEAATEAVSEAVAEEATTVTETVAEEVASVSEEVTEAQAETVNMFAQAAGETEAVAEAATEAVAEAATEAVAEAATEAVSEAAAEEATIVTETAAEEVASVSEEVIEAQAEAENAFDEITAAADTAFENMTTAAEEESEEAAEEASEKAPESTLVIPGEEETPVVIIPTVPAQNKKSASLGDILHDDFAWGEEMLEEEFEENSKRRNMFGREINTQSVTDDSDIDFESLATDEVSEDAETSTELEGFAKRFSMLEDESEEEEGPRRERRKLFDDLDDAEDTEEDDIEEDDIEEDDSEEDESEEDDSDSGFKKAMESMKAEEEQDEADDDAKEETSEVRALTPEEEKLFDPWIRDDSDRQQFAKAIDSVSMAPYTGNVIITGEAGLNTVDLSKKMIYAIKTSDSNFSGKVAKIPGGALNKKDIAQLLDGLKNGALIVEDALTMSDKTIADLHKSLQREDFGIIVILLDTKKNVKKLLNAHEELKSAFNVQVNVQPMSNDALAEYAKQYAKDMEYSIDNLGMLALHMKIDELQSARHAVNTEDVKEMMDDAIESASRKTLGHFFDILFGRRYDEEDMIIITEKDFA